MSKQFLSTSAFAKLKAKIAAKAASAPAPLPAKKPLTVDELKAKYAAILAANLGKKPAPAKKSAPVPGPLSEIARAALLRNVIDALARRGNPEWTFRVWHRYGLSSLYFADRSFLSYNRKGECITGLAKDVPFPAAGPTIAETVRARLGLEKITRTRAS